MIPSSPLKKIYFTEPPICYNIFKYERPSCSTFAKELFSNPNYRNELAKYRKSYEFDNFSPEDFYCDWADLYCKFIFLEREGVLEIGIDQLLCKEKESDEEER